MNIVKAGNHRFASLDAMRAIAALLVVWQHFAETLIKIPGVSSHGVFLVDFAQSVDFGRIGVIIFFLVSGYIIPSSLNNSSNNPIKLFAIKRFFRLYPAYWASIVLAIIIGNIFLDHSYSLQQILANATMLQTFFGEEHIQGLYWTLQIELIFYTLCCVLHYLGVLRNTRFIFLTCFLLLVVFAALQTSAKHHLVDIPKELIYAPFLISIMFFGSIYRTYHDALAKGSTTKAHLYILLLTAIMCFSVPVINIAAYALQGTRLSENPLRFGLSHLIGLFIFSVGMIALRTPPRILARIGVVSYSVYLLHPLVMYTVKHMVEANSFLLANPTHVSVYMLASLLICLGISSLMYKFIESPAINIGHKFTRSPGHIAASSANLAPVGRGVDGASSREAKSSDTN